MKRLFAFLLCGLGLCAHPMGNFSVSHYSKLQLTAHDVQLQYVLDLAEIPTFELLRTWQIDRSASTQDIHEHAIAQARDWLSHLAIQANGRPVKAHLDAVKATIADGAGNLPILRVDMRAHIDASGGVLEFEDGNYPERAGWKEIVTIGGTNVLLTKVSQSDKDLSQALTHYPPDPTVAPPQDLHAQVQWKVVLPMLAAIKSGASRAPVATPAVTSIPQPHIAPAAVAPATMTAAGAPAGAVVRGDYLSLLLHQKQLSLSMILLALAAAFGLGAVHALTPGHGKAIVAAYLVGARGTVKHAAFLGAMVTFTHTITVFALGLATLFLFRFIVPEKITVFLGALSGLSIVAIGAFMLGKRVRQGGRGHSHSHAHTHAPVHSHANAQIHIHTHADGTTHSHSHAPTHKHVHEHVHSHEHSHTHKHDHALAAHTQAGTHAHTHSHGIFGSHTHAHVPEDLSWGGLVALGASGGLVPCESALVLLLGAIALGRIGLGLLLLVSFSLGLALVLMVIGILVLYAKNLLPERTRSGGHPLLRWASIASPAIVMLVGLVMTAASLGLIQSKWMIG